MRLLPDITPLRLSREFRLLFASGTISNLGSFMTYVALPFQIKELTGSYVAVGIIGIIEIVPLIVMGLIGGALADAVDRRKMIIWAEVGAAACTIVLLVNSLAPRPHVWVLYLVAFLFTCCTGLQRPSVDSLVPRVVRHQDMSAVATWQSLRWQLGMIVGSSAGGFVAAEFGAHSVYALDVATYAISVLLLMRLRPATPSAAAGKASIASIAEGARYARQRPDLMGTYIIDILAMVFAFPNAVFPFFADKFDQPNALGLLYAAGTAGAMAVSATNSWSQRVHRHGRVIVWAAAAWGLAIACAGMAGELWLAVAFLALAGAADMVSGIFRSTIWNQTIPDEIRGRLAGIELLSYSIGPQAGQMRVSAFAEWFGLRRAIVSGGILCVAGSMISALALRELWNYDDRENEHAQREREKRSENAA